MMAKCTVLKFTHALFVWYLSGLIIFAAILFGHSVCRTQNPRQDALSSTARMDALNYQQIVELMYLYEEGKRSNVAFFPIYPALCRLLFRLTSLNSDLCLLLISNTFFLFTLFLVLCLSQERRDTKQELAVVLLALMPPSFFFRMGYSESTFTFFTALALLGMYRRWPNLVLAVIAGAATGTRPVGLAVAAAVWWYVFPRRHVSSSRTSDFPIMSTTQKRSYIHPLMGKYLRFLLIIPLTCWGLLGYMAYLWWSYDAPLAFVQTQEHWTLLAPKNYTFFDKLWSLFTFEPIWNVYNPNSQRYWMNEDTQDNPLFNCQFWNPLFYLLSWFLISLGWWKKWLKDYELVLSFGLLLIPYFTRAYEMSMASHMRFAAVVIPQYFVLSRLCAMLPPVVAGCIYGLMGLMMGLWTALFVAGYGFF